MDGRLKLNVSALKTLRRCKGLSQEATARDCFNRGFTISLATLKRAESGKSVLYRTANNIALYYGVNLPDLMAASEITSITAPSLN